MTSKDIIYLKSTNPITILDIPDPKSLEFVSIFLNDSTLYSKIFELRKSLGLPDKGIDIRPLVNKQLLSSTNAVIDTVVSTIAMTVDILRKSVGMTDMMTDQFVLLICFNAVIDLKYFKGLISHPIQFILKKKNIASTMFDYTHEVGAIIIPYTVSQNQLIKWIEKNWKDIQNKMDQPEALTDNPYLLKIHKNTEITMEIIDLKDRQSKTFSDIASILTDKYPSDERVTKEEWVKETYYYSKKIPLKQPKT